MSEQWDVMDERERIRWLLEHVLKWPYFQSYEEMDDELFRLAGEHQDMSRPHASWNEQDACWYAYYDDDYTSEVFDPLNNMDDAWKLVIQLDKMSTQLNETGYSTIEAVFLDKMKVSLYDPITLEELASWTPERLCAAVYYAAQRMKKKRNKP